MLLHGCTVGSRSLVGMGSIMLDGATLGEEAMLGAGSLVTSRTELAARHLCLGRPAKARRPLSEAEVASIQEGARVYVEKCREYLAELADPKPSGPSA